MYTAPLLPELELPELRTSQPLTPIEPAFDDCKTKAPLLLALPYPLKIDTRPPVAVVSDDKPADTTISPPAAVFPDPTVTYTAPPLPPAVEPDPIYKAPELPDVALPVLSNNIPLDPAVPAFTVSSTNDPLVDAEPYPVIIDMRPPVNAADVMPDDNTISPPVFVSPEPTVTYTAPDRPDDADPDPMYKAPELPDVALPVLSNNIPLDPEVPAFTVCSTNDPLVVAVP